MAYNFIWENNGLYWKFSGTLDTHDLIHANSELVGNKKFETLKYIIWDALELDVSKLDKIAPELAATFAASVDHLNPEIKVAFLTQDNNAIELIKQYIALTLLKVAHAQQQIFSNIDSARIWISE